MALKAALLASAGLVLGVAAASADGSRLGWYGSLEGGWSFVQGVETVYAIDRSAYPDLQERNVNLGDGVNGAVYLGYRLNSGWDLGLGVRALVTLGNRDTTVRDGPYVPPDGGRPPLSAGGPVHNDAEGYPDAYEYSHARADTDLTSVMLDFEAGYDAGIGTGFDLRIFGGLRAGFITTDTDMTFGYSMAELSDGNFQIDRSSSFTGAGPRLGVMGSLPLGESFSLFGGLDGAVLFGQAKTHFSISGYGEENSVSTSEFRTVYQLGGEIGVSYDLAGAGILGSVQLGYRGAQTWNAVDGRTPGDVIDPPLNGLRFGDPKDDLTTHGPFIRVVFQF